MSSESGARATDEWGGLRPDLARAFDDGSDSSSSSSDEVGSDAARAANQELVNSWLADSTYSIPGMSARPNSCGRWYPYHVCDECGKPIFSESHCGLRRCPECWYQWVRDTAEKIVVRIQAYRWAQDAGLDRRVVHAMFSPDQERDWTVSRIAGMRRDSYEKAENAGVVGGCALTHLWRTNDDFEEEYATDMPYASKWKYLRETYGKGWRRATEVAPHMHQIAPAPEFEPERDGWIAKRVRTLASMKSLSNLDSYEDIAGLAMYLLSHTAIGEGEQALRWFGELYPGGFNPEEELSSGALDTIERKAAEAVAPDGEGEDDEQDDVILDEDGECAAGTEGCAGQPMPIWDVPAALRMNWWDDLDRETEREMRAAVDWMFGDVKPPPGLKHPTTEAEARESLTVLIGGPNG